MKNYRKMLLLSLTLVFFLAGCKSSVEVVKVATKPMTEQFIIGSMLKQLIEQDTDISIELTDGVGGGTSNIMPGIENGDFDIYPEYTGTGWNQVLGETSNYDESKFNQLQAKYKEKSLVWKGMLGFNNTYGIAVTQAVADKYDIKTFSDLAKHSADLSFGAEYDFFEREDGYKALQDVYGMQFKSTTDLDIGLKYDAIKEGKVNVMNLFTTDGQLSEAGVVVLEDDKGLYPSYMCGFVIKMETLEKHPELETIFSKLENIITDADMAEMNHRVESLKEDPKAVATEYLKNKGLLK